MESFFPELEETKELVSFQEIKRSKYTVAFIPGDLLFHIRFSQMELYFEFTSLIDEKHRGVEVVESVDETHSFRYLDGKIFIGFADDTENPAVDENPYLFVVTGGEDPDFKGGCYVYVQNISMIW